MACAGPAGSAATPRQLGIEPGILLAFLRQPRAEKLRVDAEHAPAAGVESEAIGAEYRQPPLQAVRIDDLGGFLAGRLVADIVIAGNGVDRRLQSTER